MFSNKIYEIKEYYLSGKSAYFKCFNGKSDVVCNEIKKGNKWKIDLHNKLLKFNLDKNSVAIEAGTHLCTLTCLLANLCKIVYGFEPFPETYELALENLKLNHINNVILSNKALSNENNKTIKVEYHNPLLRNIGDGESILLKIKNILYQIIL